MYKTITLFILLLSSIFSLKAEESDNLDELFQLLELESMMQVMQTQINTMTQQMSYASGVSPEEIELNNKIYENTTKIINRELTWDILSTELKIIYRQNYTAQEIEDLITFYKTPTGRSVIKKTPIVSQDTMQVMGNLMSEILPLINEENAPLLKEYSEKALEKKKTELDALLESEGAYRNTQN